MDLTIDSTPENARRVLTALQAVPDAADWEKLAINIQQRTKDGLPVPVLAGLSRPEPGQCEYPSRASAT